MTHNVPLAKFVLMRVYIFITSEFGSILEVFGTCFSTLMPMWEAVEFAACDSLNEVKKRGLCAPYLTFIHDACT